MTCRKWMNEEESTTRCASNAEALHSDLSRRYERRWCMRRGCSASLAPSCARPLAVARLGQKPGRERRHIRSSPQDGVRCAGDARARTTISGPRRSSSACSRRSTSTTLSQSAWTRGDMLLVTAQGYCRTPLPAQAESVAMIEKCWLFKGEQPVGGPPSMRPTVDDWRCMREIARPASDQRAVDRSGTLCVRHIRHMQDACTYALPPSPSALVASSGPGEWITRGSRTLGSSGDVLRRAASARSFRSSGPQSTLLRTCLTCRRASFLMISALSCSGKCNNKHGGQ